MPSKLRPFARGCRNRGKGRGALVPPFFDRSVTLINQGGRLCPPQYYSPPSDFHTFRHPCYLVSKVDVRQDLHSICDRFTSFLKKSVNVNSFILENNLELVMFRVWNYYAMQMSTNIFILQMSFLYLWFNLITICQYGSKM